MVKTCFVISAIAEDGSQTRKEADDKFDLVYLPILKEMDYKITRSDKINSSGSISREIIQHLVSDDLVIADISNENANVFYELAVRNAVKKPVVVFKRPEQSMPFDIYDKRAISISSADPRVWEQSKKALQDHVKMVENNPEHASKSILTEFTFNLENVSPKTNYGKIYSLLKDMQYDITQISKNQPYDVPRKQQSIKNMINNIDGKCVSIPPGSSFSGCEKNHACFLPPVQTIKRGQQILWINDDNVAHNVVSGTMDKESGKEFDSSLMMAGTTFVHRFDEAGVYPYFSIIHPWQTGKIIVE